jgi:uncharacterized protein YdaL
MTVHCTVSTSASKAKVVVISKTIWRFSGITGLRFSRKSKIVLYSLRSVDSDDVRLPWITNRLAPVRGAIDTIVYGVPLETDENHLMGIHT